MATWRMLFRQVSGVLASQARTQATVRPSTCPSSPLGVLSGQVGDAAGWV